MTLKLINGLKVVSSLSSSSSLSLSSLLLLLLLLSLSFSILSLSSSLLLLLDINFDDYLAKKITAPLVPQLSSTTDSSR